MKNCPTQDKGVRRGAWKDKKGQRGLPTRNPRLRPTQNPGQAQPSFDCQGGRMKNPRQGQHRTQDKRCARYRILSKMTRQALARPQTRAGISSREEEVCPSNPNNERVMTMVIFLPSAVESCGGSHGISSREEGVCSSYS